MILISNHFEAGDFFYFDLKSHFDYMTSILNWILISVGKDYKIFSNTGQLRQILWQ